MAIEDVAAEPAGVPLTIGILHKRSPYTVSQTVLRLASAIRAAGELPVFVVDHSGEAGRVGNQLRDTKIVGFEDPAVASQIIEASPLAALDLPLRLLVWMDYDGSVWVSYHDATWLAERHGISEELTKQLAGIDELIAEAVVSTEEEAPEPGPTSDMG